MNLKEFKDEFRLICTDNWGDAMDSWFEVVGRMYEYGITIPLKYQYSPGLLPTEEGSYFHEIFKESKIEDLINISEFLFRYCQYLRYKGISY